MRHTLSLAGGTGSLGYDNTTQTGHFQWLTDGHAAKGAGYAVLEERLRDAMRQDSATENCTFSDEPTGLKIEKLNMAGAMNVVGILHDLNAKIKTRRALEDIVNPTNSPWASAPTNGRQPGETWGATQESRPDTSKERQ